MIESTALNAQIIATELEEKKVIRVGFNISTLYVKIDEMNDGTSHRTESQKLLKTAHYTFTTVGSRKIEKVLQNTLYPEIMEANERILLSESKWKFEQVVWSEIVFNAFDITKSGICGSYIPLPKKLENSYSIINVKNDDNKCFMYSIFSYFFKNNRHKRHLISTYRDTTAMIAYIKCNFGIELDFSNLNFPISLIDIPIFEKNNPRVSVNVFGLINSTNCRLYPLKNVDVEKEFHFDLLYLKQKSNPENDEYFEESEEESEEDEENRRCFEDHYCLITNLATLLRSQLTSDHSKIVVCKRCLAIFRGENKEEKLQLHKAYCNKNTVEPARYIMARDGEKFHYQAKGNENPLDYCLFADFETMLQVPNSNLETEEEMEVDEEDNDEPSILEKKIFSKLGKLRTSNLKVLRNHIPVCYATYIVSPEDRWDSEAMENVEKSRIYLGRDATQNFVNYVKEIGYKVMEAVNRYPAVPNMTEDERTRILFPAKRCILCNSPFMYDEDVKCIHHCHRTGEILGIAHTSCNLKFKRQNFLPIFFHNGSRYDFHLIMQSSFNGANIRVIPHTEETYISFTIYISKTFSLRFIDTYRFLSESLKNLATLLSPNEFHNVNNYFKNDEFSSLAKRKSFYPYEYVSSFDKYSEEQLPNKDAFKDSATGKELSDDDYKFAQIVWNKFDCKNFGDYTKKYCMIDVLLLSDIFCSFRKMCLKYYKLEPAKYITLPSYAFDVMKKLTNASLDLFTNDQVNMYCFFEKSVRGGITNTIKRYVAANSKFMLEIYDPTKPPLSIIYIDANALYSWAMRQFLPVSNFTELSSDCFPEFTPIFIANLGDEDDYGYYFEVDLDYPEELHDKHNNLPFLCEKNTIDKAEKLLCTLENKRNYHLHCRMLKLALKHGLILIKIHKIIKFKQAPILRPYIDLNTKLRANTKSTFEKSMFKLMCNAIFGKTIENARKRLNFTLATSVEKYNKLVSHTNFKETVYFHQNLVGINRYKTSVSLKLPIYLGASILDLSKVLMYDFYYEKMPEIFDNVKYELCYMDTDSFIFTLQDHSLAPYLKKCPQYFDLSDYPESHELHNVNNKKVPGVFKDELVGKFVSEFISLAPKVYAYKLYEGNEVKKAKGVLKTIVNKELCFDNYKKTLFENEIHVKSQQLFNVHSHNIRTIEQNKVALALRKNCKREFYDKINSYAFGHYKICNSIDEDEEMSE
ncbi:unnamed protein product [Brugia timori]|uniref:DNA-directed DNA polymerase n=1 Tax=Brugia timori TaxID=42155 RepID=A0A0R3Q3Q0_9BILA|nr:unnamed protein product [Brugia timori]